MPGLTNSVGPLVLPVPAGVANTPIDDPTVTGLLDYLAFWIRTSLNPKLTTLPTGRLDAPGFVTDAVPLANRFPWDPAGFFVRGDQEGDSTPFPSLYCWWSGRSTQERYSLVKSMRRRELGVCWIFEELTLPGALIDRHGLRGAVDAAIQSAIDLGHHPAYSYNGGPLGTHIAVSLGLSGAGVRYEGGTQGMMAPIPGQGAANAGLQTGRADGHVVRAYPSVQVTLNVWEQIRPFDAVDPGDVADSMLTNLRANGEGGVDDATEILERYLDRPDGTETFPNP
jgi:hypothetical protein